MNYSTGFLKLIHDTKTRVYEIAIEQAREPFN
jgi:hypothetical protein